MPRGIMDSHLLRMRVNASVKPEFVRLLIDEAAYVETQVHLAGKGSIMHGLNSSIVKDLLLFLPAVEEQAAILEFLNRETAMIDELVTEQHRLMELLKEKRQALILHSITNGVNSHAVLKPSGIGWLGEVPEHWSVKRLKHISPAITVGIVVNPSTYVTENGLPFIHGGDIREGIIDSCNARKISQEASALNSKTRLIDGDVLTVRVGATRGATAVVPPECVGGNCASVMLIRRGHFNSDWLCFVMNARLIQYQIEIVEYGAAQPQFNISHAVNFWAPTPPRSEQDAIVAHLKSELAKLDTLTAEAQRAIDLLQERRTALISAAVTGQIDVRPIMERNAA